MPCSRESQGTARLSNEKEFRFGSSLVDRAVIYECWNPTYDLGCRIADVGDRLTPAISRHLLQFLVPRLPVMELVGTLNYDDMRSAVWLQIKPRPAFAIIGGLLLCLCAVMTSDLIFHWSGKTHGANGWVFTFALMFFPLYFFVWLPQRIKRLFEQDKLAQKEFRIVASVDGLEFITGQGQTKILWSDYRKWREGKMLFLLYLSDVRTQAIPKRLFDSPEDVSAFRDLLRANVKQF